MYSSEVTFEFLHFDKNWEKFYNSDSDFINKEKIRHQLIYKNKTYVLFEKHILSSEYLKANYSLETTDTTTSLSLKYCDDKISFDYFMQILYGKYPSL